MGSSARLCQYVRNERSDARRPKPSGGECAKSQMNRMILQRKAMMCAEFRWSSQKVDRSVCRNTGNHSVVRNKFARRACLKDSCARASSQGLDVLVASGLQTMAKSKSAQLCSTPGFARSTAINAHDQEAAPLDTVMIVHHHVLQYCLLEFDAPL